MAGEVKVCCNNLNNKLLSLSSKDKESIFYDKVRKMVDYYLIQHKPLREV